MTRLRRSELSTPGSSERMLAKAAASDADLVFCDLEDSVAPAAKVEARATVINALRTLDWGGKTRAVRINGADTPWAHEDLIDVVQAAGDAVDVLILPKVREPRDVWWVETLLNQLEIRSPRRRPVGLEVLIEEVEGLVNVEAIARSSPRIEALIFGPGDLAASQGVRPAALSGEDAWDLWHYARARIVVAARAAGVEAIDGPFADFRDADGYRRECRRSSALGFTGKWAIHPAQVPIANEVYAPTDGEIAAARRVVEAYREATEGGAGAAGMGGMMIDAATVRIMEGVLRRAELARGSGPGTAAPPREESPADGV